MIYPGRNIYNHKPMMKMIVDIGKYKSIPTKDILGFNDKLLSSFPGLRTSPCGLGYEGGFLEKLASGTYLAHVLEHVILEMQAMIGYDVHYGKTRMIGDEDTSIYYLVYEYGNEVCGLECGKTAVFILNCFLNNDNLDVTEFIKYLKRISLESELGPSTSAIVNEAKKRGLPITRISNESLVQIGYGKNSRIIESTLTDATSCIAADIACNKQLTKNILTENHIPVPYGKVVYSEISAVIAARQIGYPVVLKPFDGNQGKGVFLNLSSEDDIKTAFKEASKYSNGIIVEKYITGRDFRVLVVGDKVSAVSERLPAMVKGDGVHSIKELIDIVNSDEQRGESHEKPLTKLKIDEIATNLLEKLNMTEDSIPKDGEVIKLRKNGNLSTGGTAIDFTDSIHPENVELSILAAKAIGIDIAGIDIVTQDISKSMLETEGCIVEVNAAPGIRMHIYPSEGQPRNVAIDIVDHLFPTEDSYLFPIVSVTGTNGKTTTVRLISHVLSLYGKTVGMTSTSGTYIDGKCLCKGDHSGPRSARSLLSNKKIDCAVLETARGGIIREGLGYDLADVGMVLNIADDHLGCDGIETLEDLADVKSLVTESVKDTGYAVFNAADKMTPHLMARTDANKILFFNKPMAESPISHEDLIYVCAENNQIVIYDHVKNTPIIPIPDIPITYDGKIECNIENALAAVSALYALNIPADIIAEGLKTFQDNSGRFNIFPVKDFHVMLDYGHNLPGYKEVIKACKSIGYSRLVGVIGLPGDRENDSIKEVGNFCSQVFDQIYIKEDNDLRGREKNEVAQMLLDSILSHNYEKNNVKIIHDELAAMNEAISHAEKGDLVVVFYENLEPLKDELLSI